MPNEINGILDAFNAQNTPKTNTNLDIENPYELGGPINDPASGFEQKYTPSNPYYTTNEGVVQLDSNLAKVQEDDPASSGLNLETAEADGIGGPNKISTDIPSGEYTNTTTGGKGYGAGTPGSKLNTVQVQRYTPDNPYFQVGNVPTPPEPSPNGGESETGESTPTVPNSPDSSIAPDDASNVGQFTDI